MYTAAKVTANLPRLAQLILRLTQPIRACIRSSIPRRRRRRLQRARAICARARVLVCAIVPVRAACVHRARFLYFFARKNACSDYNVLYMMLTESIDCMPECIEQHNACCPLSARGAGGWGRKARHQTARRSCATRGAGPGRSARRQPPPARNETQV